MHSALTKHSGSGVSLCLCAIDLVEEETIMVRVHMSVFYTRGRAASQLWMLPYSVQDND